MKTGGALDFTFLLLPMNLNPKKLGNYIQVYTGRVKKLINTQ
jgi:hypothetical protein